MNRQLLIDGLNMGKPEDNAFVMPGEPDIELTQEGDNWQVEVKGFAIFDSSSGNTKFGGKKGIYFRLRL